MDKIQQLFEEWQKLQPLKPEEQKRLDDKFRLEFNYNSNHIEGNTLTYGQTQLLLIFGDTTGNAKMRDYEEMKAHDVGLRWIEEVAKDKFRQLTESDIRNLNKIVLVEDFWKVNPKNGSRFKINVGMYKKRLNSVITATGVIFHYASPEETPAMMHEFVPWLNNEIAKRNMSPIELASLLHYRYIRIHPFEDGNGRIARLLVTYVLKRFGYPMVIIKSDDKGNYLRTLNQCDINVGLTSSDGANAQLKNIEPFVEYMKQQLEWSLDVSIKAAKGENIEEKGDFAKKIAIFKRNQLRKAIEKNSKIVEQTLINTYLRIAEQMVRELTDMIDLFDSFFMTIEKPKKIEPSRTLLESITPILTRKKEPAKYTCPDKFNRVSSIQYNIANKEYNYFKLTRFDIYFHFNGFRYNEKNTFDSQFTLWIKFNTNNYEIGTDISESRFEQPYDTQIVEEEWRAFASKICGAFLEKVKSQAEK